MKLPLVGTRIGIMAFKLLVALIVILSIMPLLMGNISLDFQNDHDSDWSFEDGVITMSAPLMVKNNGFFDINDVTLKFALMDQSGKVLATSQGDSTDIPAGGTTPLDLGISLDLNDIPRADFTNIVFNGSDLRFQIGLSAEYSLDLVRGSVTVINDLNWEPMVRDMDIQTEQAWLASNGDEYSMNIPYAFYTSDLVNGQTMLVQISFEDGMGNVSAFVTTVQADQYNQGIATMPISMETYDRLMTSPEELNAGFTIGVLDCSKTINESWGWTP